MSKKNDPPLDYFEEKAQEIEERKERLKQEREQKKKAKITQQKRAVQEKLFAPVLLILTVIVSFLIILFK